MKYSPALNTAFLFANVAFGIAGTITVFSGHYAIGFALIAIQITLLLLHVLWGKIVRY